MFFLLQNLSILMDEIIILFHNLMFVLFSHQQSGELSEESDYD